ncbi:hypothetical protein N9I31_03975 [Candidatus Pseudothioglobus singularis]|nr:hypothetical protein [Candidatus Pseudothioglobus singularis]
MFKKIINFMYGLRDRQRILISLTKGSAMMRARTIDFKNPETWEFSGFSQNGEDGILDVLRSKLLETNRYFIEIGAADGIDNNSAWLTIAEKYRGIMIEGDHGLIARARRMISHYSLGLQILEMFVDIDSVKSIKEKSLFDNPDVLSLDIDGIDYYIAKAMFDEGFRPKIFVVEYNSAFGPSVSRTIKYQNNFVFTSAHPTQLYYGVSIAGWIKLFEEKGYRFITVDRNGVNAFFVDPECFDDDFLDSITPLSFAENQLQLLKFRSTYEEQFKQISHMDFHEI